MIRVLLIILLSCSGVRAATINAASASEADIVTAIAASSDGDTVQIPSGVGLLTNQINVTKAIHLKGAGTASTIFEDWHTSGYVFSFTLTPGKTNRVSNFQIKPGQTSTYYTPAAIYVTGYNTNTNRIRIHDLVLTNLYRYAFLIETALGVIDHVTNYFQVSAGIGYVKGSSWDGSSNGDGAWKAPDQFGTENFIFFEDCHFEYLGAVVHATGLDSQAGGRYVARNNYMRKTSFETHGNESGQRERSGRAFEIYGNTFSGADLGQQITLMRGGVGVIFSNTVAGYQAAANPMKLSNYRSVATFPPWTGATGTNGWDTNTQASAFATGTATGSNNLSLTVAGSPWSVNQWVGYSILRTSDLIGSGNQFHSEITANTANTITWLTSAVANELRVAVGDTFSIYKVEHSLDQVGRCCDSDLLSGATPTIPAGWHQLTSPWYEWENYREGAADIGFAANHAVIRAGEHYTNNTAKPGYTPYTYPHPLVSGASEPALPATGREKRLRGIRFR